MGLKGYMLWVMGQLDSKCSGLYILTGQSHHCICLTGQSYHSICFPLPAERVRVE
jgi:hypothetical protein